MHYNRVEHGNGWSQWGRVQLIITDTIDKMKKLTLSIGLVAAILSAKAQDTSCTYFTGKDVYEFDYKMDTVLSYDKQTTKFYTIEVGYRQVLCLDLSDNKNRIRKVVTIHGNGDTTAQVLDSENNVYFSGLGPLKILVGKPRVIIAGLPPRN